VRTPDVSTGIWFKHQGRIEMKTRHSSKEMAATYARLVKAFREHGTRWYERDLTYDLSITSEVEDMLQTSAYFGDCRYSDEQVQAASSLIAYAAREADNDAWIGHPDADPNDTDRAAEAVSVPICAIVES
jgi:hypothetical protein